MAFSNAPAIILEVPRPEPVKLILNPCPFVEVTLERTLGKRGGAHNMEARAQRLRELFFKRVRRRERDQADVQKRLFKHQISNTRRALVAAIVRF